MLELIFNNVGLDVPDVINLTLDSWNHSYSNFFIQVGTAS